MSLNESMEKFITKVKSKAQELRAVGINISTARTSNIILAGLPRDYLPVVTAMTTRPGDLRMEEVIDAVLSHEATPKRFDSSIYKPLPQLHHSPAVTAMSHIPHQTIDSPVACLPCPNRNYNWQHNQHSGGPSWNHQLDNYPRQQYGGPPVRLGYASQYRVFLYASSGSSGESLRCYYCGKLRHTQNVCFNKFPHLKPAWMIDEERQRSLTRVEEETQMGLGTGANTRPLGEQYDSRRNQPSLQQRIEFQDHARQDTRSSTNHNNRGQGSSNQSYHNAATALQSNYSCDIQRDTLHFDHAFATVNMDDTPFNYSIERARLSTRTSTKWLGDSGASSYYSGNKDLFVYLEQIDDTPVLSVNGWLIATGKGTIPLVIIWYEKGEQWRRNLFLEDLLYIPTLASGCNLL